MSEVMRKHRFFAVLTLFLSGLALFPFNSLSREVFGWQAFAGGYIDTGNKLFSDGFESGDTGNWAATIPEVGFVFEPAPKKSSFEADYRFDLATLATKLDAAAEVLVGFRSRSERLFSIDYRFRDNSVELRARVKNQDRSWATSGWKPVVGGFRKVTVEWSPAHEQAADGLLYLSLDDDLFLWVDGVDNPHGIISELGLLLIKRQQVVHQTQVRVN